MLIIKAVNKSLLLINVRWNGMYTIGRVLIFPSLRYWPRIYTESIGIYNDRLGQNGFDIRDLYYFHRYAWLIDWLIIV